MKKILVVDDQAEVREFLCDFLALKGYQVVQAANGQLALDVFEQEQPDAAIVDVEMPVMNGLQFSRCILERIAEFPILIITAFLKKYAQDEITGIGVRKVLPKPIDLNLLHHEILAVIH